MPLCSARDPRPGRHLACSRDDGGMPDLATLLRDDHDELERLVRDMLDPATVAAERVVLLDTLRATFTAHAAAQGTVFHDALPDDASMRQRAIVSMVFDEHREHARAIATLVRVDPASPEWDALLGELLDNMREHARAEELVRASFADLLPADVRHALPDGYTTERMRRLR